MPQRILDRVTLWTPPMVVFLLCVTYWLWPEFYLRYLIARNIREYQAVEMMTLLLAVAATYVLARGTTDLWKLHRSERPFGAGMILRTGIWIVGLCTLAMFFFAGEEMNWGQTFVHWGVPEDQKPHEINIHNHFEILLTVMHFGDLFLLFFFGALPLMWLARERLHLPDAWAPAIPTKPVIISIVFASGWEKMKYLFLAFSPDGATSSLYLTFFEELNEHKEMLFAFSFLMYGLYIRLHINQSLRKTS